jgi:hypothetical protein
LYLLRFFSFDFSSSFFLFIQDLRKKHALNEKVFDCQNRLNSNWLHAICFIMHTNSNEKYKKTSIFIETLMLNTLERNELT